jgi:signal transduction histidine kinase
MSRALWCDDRLVLYFSYSNGYGKQVPIAFDISPSVCDAVITDEEWLWQMLLNLLTNACKYTDKGGITVNIKIDPTITLPIAENVATPVALLFEVADTGTFHSRGIPTSVHLAVI